MVFTKPIDILEFMGPLALIGIDPGISTGIAVAYLKPSTDEYQFITATCTEPVQVEEYIRPPVQVIIVERFSAQLISKYGIATVELVGGIKALCRREHIRLIEDTPQQRKPYIEKARSLIPGGSTHAKRHEVDALAHVVRFLYQHKYLTTTLKPDDTS